MNFAPNLTINADKDTLGLPEGFLETAANAMEELSRKIPGDGSLTVDVEREGGGYKIMIRMVASSFTLSETRSSRSPFVALEKVLLKTNEALDLWAINRKF